MGVRDELDLAWSIFMEDKPGKRSGWTQDQRWRSDNPGELAKLLDYRAGGTRPVLVTEPGRRMVAETAAWLATAPVEPPPPPPSGPAFTGWDASLRPAFAASRTVVCTTAAQVMSAWAALQPGDLVDVRGVTFTGQANFASKRLSGWAEVHFDSACRFLGNGPRGGYAAWVPNVANVRFYGGDVTNPTGHGIRIEDSDVFWWGFNVHDVAGGCVSAFGLAKPCAVDIRGDVSRNGGDLTLDNHAEKGTGLHGVYLAGGNFLTSGTCIVTAHDLPAGAAVEIGPKADLVCEVDARRLTFQAQSQVAGNPLQLWGSSVKLRVPFMYGEDLAGRMVETDALGTADVVVAYGRSQRVRLAPAYAPKAGVVYQDCA